MVFFPPECVMLLSVTHNIEALVYGFCLVSILASDVAMPFSQRYQSHYVNTA